METMMPKLVSAQKMMHAVHDIIQTMLTRPMSLALYGIASAPAPIALWNNTNEPVRIESGLIGDSDFANIE